MGVTIEGGVSTGGLAQKGRRRDLRQLLRWLLIGLTYLDPMALAAYQVAVMEAGADGGRDQVPRRLDAARWKRPVWAATPNLGPIAEADFSTQPGTRSAPASAEVI